MAGPNPPKPSSAAAAASNSHRKSRWESSSASNRNLPSDPKSATKPNPSPKPPPSPNQLHNKPLPDPNPNPSPAFPFPDPAALGPPPPPTYGFHMLERRTIVLYDGSVRSYFALPPDYQDLPPRPPLLVPPEFGSPPLGFRDNRDYRNRAGPDAFLMKRKYGEGDRDPRDEKREESARHRFGHYPNPNGYQLGPGRPELLAGTSSPFGNEEMRAAKYMRVGGGYENNTGFNKHLDVDQAKLNKAFLHFVKMIYENPQQRKSYLEDGKQGRLQCVACGRSSNDFSDMHGLIMHTYNSEHADLRVDHLGLHKALCVLVGWNYSKPPDNSKTYQFLPSDEAAANQEDLIIWPPVVIIHNTITGKGKDGRMEGLGNKAMDNKIRDLGFGSGKSKSLYARDGHQGITLVKFAGDQAGLKDAIGLAEYFEKDDHGRKAWSRVQPIKFGKDDEKNPGLVKVDERTGEKKRTLYGHLGTVTDLDKVDFDTRKRAVIVSRREYKGSK